MSKLPIFEHFLSVGNLQPKLECFFPAKTQAKICFIELGPSDLLRKAAELSSMELEETLEMDVTLDQLISNIEYDKIAWFSLFHSKQYLLHCSGLRGMYHYEGSLTTPGCQEIVQWIVMDRPMYVRRRTLVSIIIIDCILLCIDINYPFK